MTLRASDVPERLEGTVNNVRVQQLQGGRVAVDFRVFPLKREGVASNFVFTGTRFKGGIVRLPRVAKDEYDADEVRAHIEAALPFGEGVTIRLEPEVNGIVENPEEYWYLHVEIAGGIGAENAVEIVKGLAENYQPP